MMQAKLVMLAWVGIAVLAAVQPVIAQVPPAFTVTMDEFGKGTTILPTGGIVPTPTLVPAPPDPFLPGGFPPTPVVYSMALLGGPVTPGDLVLEEPVLPGTNQPQSDLLRFFQNLVFVYSDVSTTDPADAPADVGVPPAINTAGPLLVLPEAGPEAGVNGLFGYAPGPGMPGFVLGAPAGAVVYNFISDTPEPSTLVLSALAAVGLALIRRGL
jgi:hypothetical protein